MTDIVERLLDRADAVPEWAKQPGQPDYMISISRREVLEVADTIATLTRRVEEQGKLIGDLRTALIRTGRVTLAGRQSGSG